MATLVHLSANEVEAAVPKIFLVQSSVLALGIGLVTVMTPVRVAMETAILELQALLETS